MKRFFSILFTATFVILGVLFFALLNIKMAIISPEKAKNLAERGNLYAIATVYIKDNIVKNAGIVLDEGTNFEDINSSVNSNTIKPVVDRAIDDVFIAMNQSDGGGRVFPMNFSASSSKMTYSFSKYVNLNDNIAFYLARKIDFIIAFLAVMAIFFGFLAFILVKKNAEAKVTWLSNSLLVLAFSLIAVYLLLNFVTPHYYDQVLQRLQFVREAKLINGVKKVVSAAINSQNMLYIVETIILFVLGISVKMITKAFAQEKLDRIDTRI